MKQPVTHVHQPPATSILEPKVSARAPTAEIRRSPRPRFGTPSSPIVADRGLSAIDLRS
jgi:hypothetical protein